MNKQGRGLGMFICRKIIESMGGQIKVESQLGRGTTIKVYLETLCQVAEAPSVSSESIHSVRVPTLPLQASRKEKILLVNDDPFILFYLRGLLETEFEIIDASSGEEALGLDGDFDAVILDYNMPGMNGVETLHAMLRKPVFADRQIGLDPVYVCLSADLDCVESLRSEPFDLHVAAFTTTDIDRIKQKIKERREALLG